MSNHSFKIAESYCLNMGGGETLERVAQRGSGGPPIPGNTQGQVGRGSQQPDLVKDVPAHCRGVGLDDL